jgi:hypothetical protein
VVAQSRIALSEKQQSARVLILRLRDQLADPEKNAETSQN